MVAKRIAPYWHIAIYTASEQDVADNMCFLKMEAETFGKKTSYVEFEHALQKLNAGDSSAANDVVRAVWGIVNGDDMKYRCFLTPSAFRTEEPDGSATEEAMVLKCVLDVERRAQVHMAFMRQSDSYVVTPCCQMPVCFVCRYSDWHEGITCAEYREELRKNNDLRVVVNANGEPVDILVCPSCFVQFEHAGGCGSIRCICGHEFHVDDIFRNAGPSWSD